MCTLPWQATRSTAAANPLGAVSRLSPFVGSCVYKMRGSPFLLEALCLSMKTKTWV